MSLRILHMADVMPSPDSGMAIWPLRRLQEWEIGPFLCTAPTDLSPGFGLIWQSGSNAFRSGVRCIADWQAR